MTAALDEAETPPSLNAIDCTELINEINLMTENTSQEERIRKMEKLFNKQPYYQHMKEVICTLYDHGMDDIEFGQKFVMAAYSYNYRPAIEFKNLYITNMQEIFNKREEIREQSPERFKNSIVLLCKYFYLTRIYSIRGAPFAKALMNYMEMLLETSSVDDIRLFSEQMCLHGKRLSEGYPGNFSQLMLQTRKVLIEKTLPTACYRILLYVFDLANNKFHPLGSNLQIFYTQQLGMLSRNKKKNFEKVAREFVYSENEFMRKLTNILTIDDTPRPGPSGNRRPVHVSDNSNIANKPGKPKKKTYSNNLSYRRNYNRGWGHDDRFDRDYT